MKIEIYKNTGEPIDLTESEIRNLVHHSLSPFGLTDNGELEIMFVDPANMQELNLKHRNINKPTDILSFPQDQYGLDNKFLGSLVISQQICNEKNESLDQVIKHGILHLLGYDHEVDENTWKAAASKIKCDL